jgi:uncharacterized membrane protein
MAIEQEETTSLKSRWSKLETSKTTVLDRGRACAELTIPSLLTKQGHKEQDTLSTPYQSLGSRAINHLASKLLLTLLPPNAPFFRLIPNKEETAPLDEVQRAELDKTLEAFERELYTYIEKKAYRVPLFEALKLLIGTGNALLRLEEGTLRVYNLEEYVVKRNALGKVIEIIIKESVHPTDVLELDLTEEENDLYTCCKIMEDGKYHLYQEVNEEPVPSSEGVVKAEDIPFLALRWTAINGENYGRGLVEQYLGDLRSLEALSQAMVEGASASSKIVFMVDPTATTRAKDLAKAKSGDFVQGRANDVTTLQVNKGSDMQIPFQLAEQIQQRLAAAFLLTEGARRNAERVTAEEIRLVAGELEDALGGIYSILSQELQLPLVKIILKDSKVQLPEGLVEPVIVTGLEALGRGHDYNKLVMFAQTLQQLLGAEIFAQATNVDAVIDRVATSLGVDVTGIIKDPEQRAQEQQQQAMAQSGQVGADAMAQSAGQEAGVGGAQAMMGG